MIITCTKCQTGFAVLEESIGSTGRRVKCSKCKNIWFASLLEEGAYLKDRKKENIPTKEDYNLPALPLKALPFGLFFTTFILLVVNILAYTIVFSDKILDNNNIIGKYLCQNHHLCNSKGIAIEDLKLKQLKINDETQYVLNYKIYNSSEDVKLMPLIRITLSDKDGKIVANHSVSARENYIQPHSRHSIETLITNSNQNILQIKIDLGNRYELALRGL